ncbi:hypothetical protein CPC08DRAFT_680482 [Agrocybe pediades]|nr:hypothetical protein CPC08DRAFT_680482 [Agrocybe pediades]
MSRRDRRPNQIVLSPETSAPALRPPPPKRPLARRSDKKLELAANHKPHPDCPDTLACLPDTDGRPGHTLPVILRCCILGSPNKRLTIREIYAAMEGKYPYYRGAGDTWKQSVRHHLSLNRLFERQPRPVTDPGFGSYWTVDLLAPPGTKRPRKRGGTGTAVIKVPKTASTSKAPVARPSPPRGGEIAVAHPPPNHMKFQFQPQTHPPPPTPPLPTPPVHQLYPVSPLTRNPLHPPTTSLFAPQPQQQPYSQISLQNSQQQAMQRQQLQFSVNSDRHSAQQMYPQHPSQYPLRSHSSHHSQSSSIPINSDSSQPVFLPVQLYPPTTPPGSISAQQQPSQRQPPPSQAPQLQSPTSLRTSRQARYQLRSEFRQEGSQSSTMLRRSSASTPVTPYSEREDVGQNLAGPSHHRRKPSTPHTPLSSQEASYPPSSGSEDGGTTDIHGPTVSDDDMLSEQEVAQQTRLRRQSLPTTFVATKPAAIFSLPPFSALDQNKNDILEHMRQEIASLRRTSAEAVSTSLRLTEQLANANLEVSRSRAAVRNLEDMLQHEAAKRKEAEKIREAEMERRRLAEHGMSSNNYPPPPPASSSSSSSGPPPSKPSSSSAPMISPTRSRQP